MLRLHGRWALPLAVALSLGAAAGAATGISINEIRIDQPSTDNDEYFELSGPAGASLDGLTYIVIGDGSAAAGSGVIEAVLSLNGRAIAADGFFLVGESTLTAGTADLVATLNFENEDNVTHLLVSGFTGANAQDLDTNDDGTLDATPWTAVVDSIALVKTTDFSANERFYGPTSIGPDGSFVPGHVFRLPDGDGEWRIGGFTLGTDDTAGETNGVPEVIVDATIPEIQGAGHVSDHAGAKVRTEGVVTARDSNGFWMQDPAGDGDEATSDGIFVFTGSAPAAAVGDRVQVVGIVAEFTPGGASTGNLSITELTAPVVTSLSSGNAHPAPVLLGPGGRTPPTEVVDDDALTVFDASLDGIDFYESLEGMRVLVDDPAVVSTRNSFGELWVLAGNGAGATGRNARGGITIAADDYNPERIQLQFDADLLPAFLPEVQIGDSIGDATGVVHYNFGNFEIVLTEPFEVTPGTLAPETTALVRAGRSLAIAGFNVLNLDPNDADGNADVADGQFARLASQIVGSLQSPDILSLQEVQDNSGSTNDGTVAANLTLQKLVEAIVAAGGPAYAFIDNPPENNQDGGEPGGNIRVAFLYDPARVALVPGSVRRIVDPNLADGDAFENSRKPLLAEFAFQGRRFTVIDVHFTSKGGSTPIFGRVQPFVNEGEAQRSAQAGVVRGVTDAILGADPAAGVVVLGDFNEFDFNPPLAVLEAAGPGALVNLTKTKPVEERYSFLFEGNGQSLDHALVSPALLDLVHHDIVHCNIEFSAAASDHDPEVVLVALPPPTAAEVLAFFDASVAAGTLAGASSSSHQAAKDLDQFRLHLDLAVDAIEDGSGDSGWAHLKNAHKFCDGSGGPPDAVKGPACAELASHIQAAIAALR